MVLLEKAPGPSARKRREKEWEARHNVPLMKLAQETDKRYRPSAKLARLVRSNTIASFRTLDRPLVPVLNQLVAKGLTTRFSCADSQIMVLGVGVEVVRLLAPLQAHMPKAKLEWCVLSEKLVTILHWKVEGWPMGDFLTNDQALLAGSEETAKLLPATSEEMHPAGELVTHAFARVERLMHYKMPPTIILHQTDKGYLLHVGHSLTGGVVTQLKASSLKSLSAKFEAAFPRPEEVIEVA
jgi:hypothetical protein